jgi:hypothetical protein
MQQQKNMNPFTVNPLISNASSYNHSQVVACLIGVPFGGIKTHFI